MTVYRVTPDKDCAAHTEDNISSAISAVNEWLIESEPGTEVTIEVLEMSRDEYDNLPEYEGP